jgi:hypothetical protein
MRSLALTGSVVLSVLVGCSDLEGGNRAPAREACVALCDRWIEGDGCEVDRDACVARCVDDTNAFTERCMLAARAYYECSLLVSWSCPVAPAEPETDDARCQDEQSDWLSCKLVGEPRP